MPPYVKTIAVDLDGTLAQHGRWRGIEHIGDPVPEMARRVKRALAAGHNVVIFTARADPRQPDHERAIEFVKQWCIRHFGVDLRVTAIKSMRMTEFWDDRAVRVGTNTGEPGDLSGTLWAEVDA